MTLKWPVVSAVIVTAAASIVTDPVFDANGFQKHRDYFSQQPFEHIDTLTGGLILTHTDLVLPGNAGRDLRSPLAANL